MYLLSSFSSLHTRGKICNSRYERKEWKESNVSRRFVRWNCTKDRRVFAPPLSFFVKVNQREKAASVSTSESGGKGEGETEREREREGEQKEGTDIKLSRRRNKRSKTKRKPSRAGYFNSNCKTFFATITFETPWAKEIGNRYPVKYPIVFEKAKEKGRKKV